VILWQCSFCSPSSYSKGGNCAFDVDDFVLNAGRQEPLQIPIAEKDHVIGVRFALRMGLTPDLLEGIVLHLHEHLFVFKRVAWKLGTVACVLILSHVHFAT
jgi:hypothetical protein